jgi:methionyl-tRNA formyltransferase
VLDVKDVGRILLFGDSWGIPQLTGALPADRICGIVAAEIRPECHAELQSMAAGFQVSFLIQPRRKSTRFQGFVGQVRELAPDLILVNSYSMLLPPEILSIPRFDCVNVHSAPLPKYRGSNPIQWAIINNESETGVTMHYMTAEFDAGDIIAQRRVPIFLPDTWLDVRSRVAGATEQMLREELPRLLAQTNDRTTQNEAEASRYPRRRPEDGEIDWSRSELDIHNLIRALVAPLPGAFYYSGGKKIVLDRYLSLAEVAELKSSQPRRSSE